MAAELIYFRIADKCNIIDKPNERSSHSTIVLRGGGIIFAISILVWAAMMLVKGEGFLDELSETCGSRFFDERSGRAERRVNG